ncbi:LPS export ABC transporter ATP-binding protein [Candidatus Hydrogenedentota bacterium]
MSETVSVLMTEELVKAYRGRRVVDEVSIQLKQGEIVGLLGPNGAGKTTTFRMIVGMLAPDMGELYLDGARISAFPMFKRARRGIAYLPQESSIFKKLTVAENMKVLLEFTDLSAKEQKDRMNALLEELGVHSLADSKGYTLSGGERRRVEIARALIMEPKFFLLDEPFAGVDPIAVEDIQQILAHLKNRGIGILMTDHNVRETLSTTDRAYILDEGKVEVEGTPQHIADSPRARQIYLGEKFTLAEKS